MNPSKRRSSILKVPKAREPFSDIDFNPSTADDDGTTKEITRGRRVSFCRKKNVAEFTSDNCTTQLIFKQDTSLINKLEKSDCQISIFDQINTSILKINNDFPNSSTNHFNPNVSMVNNMVNFHPEMSSDIEPTEAFINYKFGNGQSITGNVALDDDEIFEKIEHIHQDSNPILPKVSQDNDFGVIGHQFSQLKNEILLTNDGDMSITDAVPIPIQVVDSKKNSTSLEFKKKNVFNIDLDEGEKSPSTLEKKIAEKENIITAEMLALAKSSKRKHPKVLSNSDILPIPKTILSTVTKSDSNSTDKLFSSSEIFSSTTKPGVNKPSINISRTFQCDREMSFTQAITNNGPLDVFKIASTKIGGNVEDNNVQCISKSDLSMTSVVATDAFKNNFETHLEDTEMSMTHIINPNRTCASKIPPVEPLIGDKNNQETYHKSRQIETDLHNSSLCNMSMTHAIPSSFKDQYESDKNLGVADMSMTYAVNKNQACASKSHLIEPLIKDKNNQETYNKSRQIETGLHNSSLCNMSMTHAIPSFFKDQHETKMHLGDTDMSITHAVNRNQSYASKSFLVEPPIEHKNNQVLFNKCGQIEDSSTCNMSMTYGISISNKNQVNCMEFYDVAMSTTQCIPSPKKTTNNNKSLCDPLRFSESNIGNPRLAVEFHDVEISTTQCTTNHKKGTNSNKSLCDPLRISESTIGNPRSTEDKSISNENINNMSVTSVIPASIHQSGESLCYPLKFKLDNVDKGCINNSSELSDSQHSKEAKCSEAMSMNYIIETYANEDNDVLMTNTAISNIGQKEICPQKLTSNISINKTSKQDYVIDIVSEQKGVDLEVISQRPLNFIKNDLKSSVKYVDSVSSDHTLAVVHQDATVKLSTNENILDPPEEFVDFDNSKHIQDNNMINQIPSTATNITSIISNQNNVEIISVKLTSDQSILQVTNESKIRNEFICDDRPFKRTAPDVTSDDFSDCNTDRSNKSEEHNKIRKKSHSIEILKLEDNTKPIKDHVDNLATAYLEKTTSQCVQRQEENTNIHAINKIDTEPSVTASSKTSVLTNTSHLNLSLKIHQRNLDADCNSTSSNLNKSTLNIRESNGQVNNNLISDIFVLQSNSEKSILTNVPISTNTVYMESSEENRSTILGQQSEFHLSQSKESDLLAILDIEKRNTLETLKLHTSKECYKSPIEMVKSQDTNTSKIVFPNEIVEIENNDIKAKSSVVQNVAHPRVETNKEEEMEQDTSKHYLQSEKIDELQNMEIKNNPKVVNKSRNVGGDITNAVASSKDKCTIEESQHYTVMFGEISRISSNTTIQPNNMDKVKKSILVQSTPQKNKSTNNTTTSCDITCIPDNPINTTYIPKIPMKTSSKIPQSVKRGSFSPSKTYICEAKKFKTVDDQSDEIFHTTHKIRNTNLCQPLDKQLQNLENPSQCCSTVNPNIMQTDDITYVINKQQKKLISATKKAADGDFIIYNESPPASLLDVSHSASLLDVSPPSYVSINISSENNFDILQTENEFNNPPQNVILCEAHASKIESNCSREINKNNAVTENHLNYIAVNKTMDTNRAFVKEKSSNKDTIIENLAEDKINSEQQKLSVLNPLKTCSTEINLQREIEDPNLIKMDPRRKENTCNLDIIKPAMIFLPTVDNPIRKTVDIPVENNLEKTRSNTNAVKEIDKDKTESQLHNITVADIVSEDFPEFLKTNTTLGKKEDEEKVKQKLLLLNMQKKISTKINSSNNTDTIVKVLKLNKKVTYGNDNIVCPLKNTEPKGTPKLSLEDTIRNQISGYPCILEQSSNRRWEILLMKSKLSITVILKPHSENGTSLCSISEIEVASVLNENLRYGWERKSGIDHMLIKIALHHLNPVKLLKMYPDLGHLSQLIKHCCDFTDHLLKLSRELKLCYLVYGIQIDDNNRLMFDSLNTHLGAIWLITMDLELCNLPYPSVSQNITAKTTSGDAIISDTEMHTVANKVKGIHQNSWAVIPRMCEAVWAYCMGEAHKTDI